jgi:hypothetical protein
MFEIVIVGMKAVGALQCFFLAVGLKRSEALLAPRRLVHILRSAMFADKVIAHGFVMQESRCGFLILRGRGERFYLL